MYVSRLFIKNFRNLRHFDAEIGEGVTCFVGENNSGKTNIFHALRVLLDGNISAQRRRLQAEDLSAGLTFVVPEHVLISVEFSGFAGKPNKIIYVSQNCAPSVARLEIQLTIGMINEVQQQQNELETEVETWERIV